MIVDVSRFIPKPLLDFGYGWSNLVASIQNNVDYYISRIKALRNMYNPELTDIENETAYLVGAYVANEDNSRAVKDKISNAYYTHKNITHFTNVYKPIIDKIISGNCSLYKGLINYGVFTIETSYIDSPSLIEDLTVDNSVKPKGDIYIDLGLVPSAGQMISLRQQLEQIKPVYFNLFLGDISTFTSEVFEIDSADSMIDGYSLIETAGAVIIKFNVYLTI